MTHLLVTGGLGHIGAALLRALPAGTQRCTILDNLATQRYASLFDLPDGVLFRFHEEDILDAPLATRLDGVDATIHLAALTDAALSHERAEQVEQVNLEGLKRVADACRDADVPLLFPSTTSVYGSQQSVVDESCTELQPQSPYAASKLAAERYLQQLREGGMRCSICRLGTIFGWSIGMRFHTAVNKFIWQAVQCRPLTVWKTAWQQRRPYLDLGDCVRAFGMIVEQQLYDGEVYNVLTRNYSVEQIVGAIRRELPELTVEFVDSPIMNQLSYNVDDGRFRALGFEPAGHLEDAVAQTIRRLNPLRRAS